MAQDKRGRPPEPSVDAVMNEVAQNEGGDDFIAGPTQRNSVGNTKRAAAKATGLMGASKKLDPDLDIEHVDDGRIASGSNAGIRSFTEVPEEEDDEAGFRMSNAEIAEGAPTTANKSPAPRAARTDAGTGSSGMSGGATSRKRVPAPGTAVDVPKGTLVRGQQQRPLAKGETEDR